MKRDVLGKPLVSVEDGRLTGLGSTCPLEGEEDSCPLEVARRRLRVAAELLVEARAYMITGGGSRLTADWERRRDDWLDSGGME